MYERVGGEARERILRLLPDDWSFAGKRILDFGCGSGRTLRHFLAEAEEAELVGCDIHAPSVDWVKARPLAPGPRIPLARVAAAARGRRVLRPRVGDLGVHASRGFVELVAAGAAPAAAARGPADRDGRRTAGRQRSLGEPWDEDAIGMTVIRHWQDFDQGGPIVVHSESVAARSLGARLRVRARSIARLPSPRSHLAAARKPRAGADAGGAGTAGARRAQGGRCAAAQPGAGAARDRVGPWSSAVAHGGRGAPP